MSSPRLGFILLSLALVLPRLLGQDSPGFAATEKEPANAEPKSRSIIRSVLRENFAYDPNIRAKSLEPPSPVLASQGASDPEVVVLPKYETRSRPIDQGLPAAIARYHDPRPQNQTRFGTGIHQKDFGKIRASVVTILYVPIFFGLSW